MLINRVFKEAEPILKERSIEDAIIGLTIAAVSLDDGSVGTCFILHEELENLHEIAFEPEEIKGMPAVEMGKWAVNPNEHILKRILGIAAINACSSASCFPDAQEADASKSIQVRTDDTVGFIGYIRNLVNKMEEKAKKVIVYDNAEKENVHPPETQPLLLPTCDIVYISGTTFVNNTIDNLLDTCRNAREIILVGPTVPMFPGAYKNTNITVIAGGIWKKESKDGLFARVALNGGIPSLSRFMTKLSVRVNN